MKLLSREIKAAIFDMDGTLIDSTGIWHDIDVEFFAKRGMEVPKEYAEEIVHIGLAKAASFTKEKYGIKESEEEIKKEWRDASIDMYLNRIPLKEGAIELLKHLKENGVKLAIATANDEELYKPCLERLGIYDLFDVIMDVNSVSKGKDNVLLYNTISNKLGVKVENTMVLEDIAMPLKTSYQGGYFTIAVYDKHSEHQDKDKREHSHLYIYSFFDLLKALEK